MRRFFLIALECFLVAVFANGNFAIADVPPWVGTTTSDDGPDVGWDNDFDRPGADFWRIELGNTDSASACLAYCRSTPRCGAYSFVKASRNGGRALCYLKNAVTVSRRDTCCVSGAKGGWRAPTDAQIRSNPSLAHVPPVGGPYPPPTSTAPLPPPPPNMSQNRDTDRPGGDYGTPQPTSTPYDCAQMCSRDSTCYSYSWIKPSSPGRPGACYLKDQIVPEQTNVCCISGQKISTPATPLPTPTPSDITTEVGVDRSGGDYYSYVGRMDANACATSCFNDRARCRAYTWVRPGTQGPNAVCYMKNTVPAPRADGCCTSGVVRSSATAPTPPPTPLTPAAAYDRYPGQRLSGDSSLVFANLFAGDPRWPVGVAFSLDNCEAVCTDPNGFTRGRLERGSCEAYTYYEGRGPNPASCLLFRRGPPTIVADPGHTSGFRRR